MAGGARRKESGCREPRPRFFVSSVPTSRMKRRKLRAKHRSHQVSPTYAESFFKPLNSDKDGMRVKCMGWVAGVFSVPRCWHYSSGVFSSWWWVLSLQEVPPSVFKCRHRPESGFEFAAPHNVTYELSLITNVKLPRDSTSSPWGRWPGGWPGSPAASLSPVCRHRGPVTVSVGVSVSALECWTIRASSRTHSCSLSSALSNWVTFWVSLIHSCKRDTR